jgi:hypothetical protein
MAGSTRVRRLTAAVAALAAAVAVGGAGGPAPAAAQAPALEVTVTPATGLVDGQEVLVETPGTTDAVWLAQCDAEVVHDGPVDISRSIQHCGNQPGPAAEAPLAYTVRATFQAVGGRTITCGDAPGDCVIQVVTSGLTSHGFATLDIAPDPLVVIPSTDIVPDTLVAARVAGEPGAEVSVAQCASSGGTAVDGPCGPAVPLTLPASGVATADLTITATLAGPPEVDCEAGGCAVASFAADGSVMAVAPIELRQPVRITLTNATDLIDGELVSFTVTGYRQPGTTVAQCAAAVTTTHDVVGGPCIRLAEYGAGPEPIESRARVRRAFTGADGTEVDCSGPVGTCVIAVGIGPDDPYVAEPIGFGAQPTATVSPADDLVDGDEMTFTATGLEPSHAYTLVYCSSPFRGETSGCEPVAEEGRPVQSSADGAVTATLPARQRLGGWHPICRANCSIGVAEGERDLMVAAPYAMSAGMLTATPATGLVDGDPVAVTAPGAQPSYDGPPVWIFGSGAWGLGQCSAAVLDDPTVGGVLAHCATPPGGGAVTVPGELADVEVQATVTPFGGGPETDCTARPGACVLVLARVEADWSTSLVSTPLTFGGG